MANARVTSIQAVRDLRPALVHFAQDVARALGEADAGIARAIGQVESDLPARWTRELARRREQLARAKDAWRAKTMFKDSSGKPPSAVDERVEVERWTRQVEEAQGKLEACRRWRSALAQHQEQFRAKVRSARDLSPMMTELAVHELDRLMAAIEGYLALQGPAGGAASSGGTP